VEWLKKEGKRKVYASPMVACIKARFPN